MDISILSRNVRGLNEEARRDAVRTLVDDIRPCIVCLQETKLAVISPFTVSGMLGTDYSEFAYLPAPHTRGGILIAGRRSALSLSDVMLGCFSITVRVWTGGLMEGDTSSWWLTSVYGPQDDNAKELFLEELEAVRDACDGPWAICGDFNLILSEADKNNARINRTNLARFRRAVHTLELQDLHLHGRAFTWSNEREHPTHSSRAWSHLPLDIEPQVMAFFRCSTFTNLGNGNTALFWEDRWLHQQAPSDLAPNLAQLVPRRIRDHLTVR
jgi:exonuclease III